MSKGVKSAKAANETELLDSVTSTEIIVAPVKTSIQKSAAPLTPAEKKLLARNEKTIRKGFKTFIKVGDALVEVRDKHLYRAQYDTFEDYCLRKWKFSVRQAYHLIDASAVVHTLECEQLFTNDPVAIPGTESAARPLVTLPPDKQVEAARIVAQAPGEHTAKAFKDASDKVSGKKPKVAKAIVDVEDDAEEKPRVQCGVAPDTSSKTTNHDELETLLELVDAAQTQARKTSNCADVVKTLSDLAKVITRKLNGGGK